MDLDDFISDVNSKMDEEENQRYVIFEEPQSQEEPQWQEVLIPDVTELNPSVLPVDARTI